jgi:4'-phosphopantetheinyl transferase
LPPAPAHDEVHVLLIRPDAALSRRSVGLWLMLDRDERDRARERVRTCAHLGVANAEWFVAVHALLRSALADALRADPRSLRLGRGPGGKPCLAAPAAADGLRFSLSHTTSLAAIAMARGREVGIDVEDVREIDGAAELARRHLSPEEALHLSSVPPARRAREFLRLWTRAESRLKAVGAGLCGAAQLGAAPPAEVGPPRWETLDLALGAEQVGAVTIEGSARVRIVPWRASAAPEGAPGQFTFQRTELTANAT